MTTLINPRSIFGKSITRGRSPRNPSQLNIQLPFASDTIFVVQLPVSAQHANNTGIEGIQSVYYDNSLNVAPILLMFDSGQNITCPPFSQGIYPVFFSGEILNFSATCTGGKTASLIFLNTREQAQQWSTKVPVVNASGSTVITAPFVVAAFTDGSGTLAAGGTAQLLIAANANRQFMQIRNPAYAASQGIAAPEPVYLGYSAPAIGVNALGSWELLPGESLPTFLCQTAEAIYWNAATTGHLLTCKWA